MRSTRFLTLVLLSGALAGCIDDPFQLLQHSVPWLTVDSRHFTFHYLDDASVTWRHTPFVKMDGTVHDPTQVDAETTVRECLKVYEEWYALLVRVFPREPPRRIDVYEWSNDAQQGLLANGYSTAFVDYLKMSGDRQSIHTNYPAIPHELVHVFQFANGLGPVGWIEGMAVALAGKRETPDARHVWSTWDLRPTAALPGYSADVQEPYDSAVTDNAYYSVPIHRFAAYILGLDSDPAYPMTQGETYPGIRPSQLMSWANARPRDVRLVYVVAASWIHYLISTRGLPRLVAAYQGVSGNSFDGPDLETVFFDVYGEQLHDVEDEWEVWLRQRPAEAWSVPVNFLFPRATR